METPTDIPKNPFKRTLMYLLGGITTMTCIAVYKVYATQRKRRTSIPFLEDCLLLFAVFVTYISFTLVCVATWRYGLGQHIQYVSYEDLNEIFTLLFVAAILSIWNHALVRISLLVSVRRLYSPLPNAKRMQRFCDAFMVIEATTIFASTFWAFFSTPKNLQGSIDQLKHHRDKRNINATVGICIMGLILDCMILLSPVPLIFKLRGLSTKRKVQIVAVIGFGFLTLLASVVRLAYLMTLTPKLTLDATYYFASFITISQIEGTLAKITICLPPAAYIFNWIYADTPHRPATRGRQQATQHMQIPSAIQVIPPSPDINPINAEEKKPEVSEKITIGPDSDVSSDRDSGYGDVAEEEDDDNFFETLVPSDHFFPYATGLGPRPS